MLGIRELSRDNFAGREVRPRQAGPSWTSNRPTSGGVLWGYQTDPYPLRSEEHVSLLYVGTDGVLHGDAWVGGHVRLATPRPVNDGRWHHAAFSIGGGRAVLYLDGAVVEEKPGRVNHLRMTRNQLGNGLTGDHPAGNGSWFAFAGLLGEIRAWHLVRTAEQIKPFANRKLTGEEQGLVAYYPADEGSGAILIDHATPKRNVPIGKVRRVAGDVK